MQSPAHYALLGSLLAAAAGAVVLATVAVKHGFRRRVVHDDEQNPDAAACQHRIVRLADTVAVLCFAVSAGLGVVGVMQHTRAVPAPVAATDPAMPERMRALETRVAAAELALERHPSSPEWRAWEERLARLESRLGAVEERAVSAERRAIASEHASRARRDDRPRALPASPPRAAPPPALREPEASASPRTAPAADPTLGEKIRRDWETVKAHARRGGDEWRDAWGQLKGLFAR
jgi:hypothetical protein